MERREQIQRTYEIRGTDAAAGLLCTVVLAVHCPTLEGSFTQSFRSAEWRRGQPLLCRSLTWEGSTAVTTSSCRNTQMSLGAGVVEAHFLCRSGGCSLRGVLPGIWVLLALDGPLKEPMEVGIMWVPWEFPASSGDGSMACSAGRAVRQNRLFFSWCL